MPSQTFDTIGMRLSQLAEQHELSNNPAYFAWLQRSMADGMDREAARRHAAEAVMRFGNNPPPPNAGPQRSRPGDKGVAPPRTSTPAPPDLSGGDPQGGVPPRLSVGTQPSLSVGDANPPRSDSGLDPGRLSLAANASMRSGPAASPEEAASLRSPPSDPLPRASGQGGEPASAQAASPPAPVEQLLKTLMANGMTHEQAADAIRSKYQGVEVPPPSTPKSVPPSSVRTSDAQVRGMIDRTREPGLSREGRATRIAQAMTQNEINHLISRGYSPEDAAQMVDMKAIANAANRQLVSDEVQDGQQRGREEDAAARQRAVTATGPEARQMAAEDAVTQRIRNQNQNARTRGLGGQNRLWDENDPETRAMVAQQIAAEAKAATEKEIADTGLGSRRVPTPRGAGGERSKQGAAFESAQDAENYNRRLPAQPVLGDDGLPAGGKPGLYTPSQKDRDMAARGYVPTYGPNGEIGYSIAAFAGGENAPPGAPGRAGDRRDLRVKGWVDEERLGPTGMQRVLVPGSEVQERMLQKQDSDLIERLRTRAGVSEVQLRTLRQGADGEPGLNDTALIERLRMMGTDRKNADLEARKANVRSHAMLAGPNAARNAVNAFNTLPPDWQATVTAKSLRPDLAGTTPNDVSAARARDGGRNDELIARLSMFETQQKQAGLDRQADKEKHEADMQMRQQAFEAAQAQQAHTNNFEIEKLRAEIQRNQQQAAGPMAQADLARQNAEDIKKLKDLQEAAARTGLPVGAIQDIRDKKFDSPMTRAALAKALDESDSTWFTMGSGYSDDDEAKFKGIMRSAGVEDEAELELLFEKAKHARYKASWGIWNWR